MLGHNLREKIFVGRQFADFATSQKLFDPQKYGIPGIYFHKMFQNPQIENYDVNNLEK